MTYSERNIVPLVSQVRILYVRLLLCFASA